MRRTCRGGHGAGRAWRIALTLALAAVALQPTAASSGSLETPVLAVQLHNQHGDDCGLPRQTLCAFAFHYDGSVGDAVLDLNQQIRYVGIATDFSLFRHAAGDAWLLEDQSVLVRGQDLYVAVPAVRVMTETWQHVPQANSDYWVYMEPGWVNTSYHGPEAEDPTGPWKTGNLSFTYDTEYGYLTTERIGPPNTLGSSHTDPQVGAVPNGTCFQKTIREPCHEKVDPFVPHYFNATPDVRYGVGFHDFVVATDPANLTRWNETPEAPAEADLTGGVHGGGQGGLVEEKAPRAGPLVRGAAGRAADAPERAQRAPAGTPEEPAPLRIQGQAPAAAPPEIPVEVILGATAAGLVLLLLGAVLYSRFHSKADVLRSETRARVIDLVRQSPGISVSDAADALGLARNAVQHHVRVLERADVLRAHHQAGRCALYLAGERPTGAAPAWLLKNPTCTAMVNAIQASPAGVPRTALHALLPDVPERTRAYNIQKLLAVGIVEQVVMPDGQKILRARSHGAAKA